MKPHLAKTAFAQKIRIWPSHFRDRIWPELIFQSFDRIWPDCMWPELLFKVFRPCVYVLQDFKMLGVFKIVCAFSPPPPHRPSTGPPFPWTAQNFALFFHPISLSSISGGLLVFRRPGRSNVHVWALQLSCETPAAPKPLGHHTTTLQNLPMRSDLQKSAKFGQRRLK